jgi:hypothetical protein
VIVGLARWSAAVCGKVVAMGGRTYRLEVEGELSDWMRSAFDHIILTRDHGNTILVGRCRDQSELQGLLQRVSDLGLTLVSLRAIGDKSSSRSPG